MWRYGFLPQTWGMEDIYFEEPSAPGPCSRVSGERWRQAAGCTTIPAQDTVLPDLALKVYSSS